VAVLKVPRSLRGRTKFAAVLRYFGEDGYTPAKLRLTVRDRHFTSR
jgi:hypothetical protein